MARSCDVGAHNIKFGLSKTANYSFGALTLYNVDLEDPLGETVCQRGTGNRSALTLEPHQVSQ